MRIVSKFHDYYDGVTAGLMDPNLTYVRHEKSEMVKHPPRNWPHAISAFQALNWFASYDVYTVGVNFCGEKYVGVHIDGVTEQYVYSTKKLDSTVQQQIRDKQVTATNYNGKKKLTVDETLESWHRAVNNINWLSRQHTLVSSIGHVATDVDYLVQHKVPVMCVKFERRNALSRRHRPSFWVIENPCLRNFDFQSQVDPFTAHQELSMFLGGPLAVEHEPPVAIEDKVRVEAHGFDTTYGFRTRPHNKGK